MRLDAFKYFRQNSPSILMKTAGRPQTSPHQSPHVPRADPFSQPDIQHHFTGQRAQLRPQLVNRQCHRHQQMRLDLKSLVARHAVADDLGMDALNADAALSQNFGQAADDALAVRAVQANSRRALA